MVRAIVAREPGGPEVLELAEVADPSLADDEDIEVKMLDAVVARY